MSPAAARPPPTRPRQAHASILQSGIPRDRALAHGSMKSLLSAALSGAPDTKQAPVTAATARPLDHYAFPCLLNAGEENGNALEDGITALDLSTTPVVGSVPTNTMGPGGTPLVSTSLEGGVTRPPHVLLGAPPTPRRPHFAGRLSPGSVQTAWRQGVAQRLDHRLTGV